MVGWLVGWLTMIPIDSSVPKSIQSEENRVRTLIVAIMKMETQNPAGKQSGKK